MKTRRDLLKEIGLLIAAQPASVPIEFVVRNLWPGMMNKAMAQDLGLKVKQFIYVQQYGAPPRWMTDLMLVPYSSSGFIDSPAVGTKYVASGGRYTGIEYETWSYKGLNVPYMWQFPVAAASGGVRPLSSLLDQFTQIRGVTTENAGHLESAALHFLPLGSSRSLFALSGDLNPHPFPVVNAGTNFKHLSQSNKSAVHVNKSASNYLSFLLSPFARAAPSTFAGRRAQLDGVINQALREMDKEAVKKNPSAEPVIESRVGALRLLERGVANINESWTALVTKYTDLIKRSINPANPIPGISDLPIGGTSGRAGTYAIGSGVITSEPDLRSLIQSSTAPLDMAECFALTEYAIKEQLTSSILIGPGSFDALNVPQPIRFDEHFTGAMPSLYLNVMYYRALGSCLLELIDQIKATGQWNNTIIEVAGEFNRSAKRDGSGSDHAFNGASLSLFSGAFSQPLVVGDIIPSVSSNAYRGTWGEGADIDKFNRKLKLSDVSATIASLLGAPRPNMNASLILTNAGGNVASNIGLARIVG